jgi:hypothetical protein
MKDEEIICPHCGEIQPRETDETKENEKQRKETKVYWIVFIIVAIITMCIPLGSFWDRLMAGICFGIFAVAGVSFAIFYINEKDKK